MDNKITVDVDALLALPDYSVTDSETIRQIGLITTSYNCPKGVAIKLCKKPKKEYQIHALYPHVMKPLQPTTNEVSEMLSFIVEKRKEHKADQIR